jgi:hypothetical protein
VSVASWGAAASRALLLELAGGRWRFRGSGIKGGERRVSLTEWRGGRREYRFDVGYLDDAGILDGDIDALESVFGRSMRELPDL